jgi:hypothetical protein
VSVDPTAKAALGVQHPAGDRVGSARNSSATTPAASSGVFHRPPGIARRTRSCGSPSAQPVSVGPGLTAFTVIPRSTTASDSVRTSWASAPLVAP